MQHYLLSYFYNLNSFRRFFIFTRPLFQIVSCDSTVCILRFVKPGDYQVLLMLALVSHVEARRGLSQVLTVRAMGQRWT